MPRILLALLLAVCLVPAALARSASDIVYDRQVSGDLEINPDGSVRSHRFDDKRLAGDLRQALDRHIAGWRFEPITTPEGKPAIGTTRFTLGLKAEPLDRERMRMRIANVWFGVPQARGRLRPPVYPVEALQARLSARVVLVLRLDAEGKVEQVHVEQVGLGAKAPNEHIAESWRERFAQVAAANAKRHWRFNLTELVGDAPRAGTSVRVPVDFVIGEQRGWTAFVMGPYRPVPWVDGQSMAGQGDALRNGELQPLDSRFKLTTPVEGVYL